MRSYLSNKSSSNQRYHLLIIIPITLSIIGLVFIFEASALIGYEYYKNSFYYLYRQLFWLFIGLIGMILATKISFKSWSKYAFTLLLISIGLLFIVLIPQIGVKIGGARRWIDLGILSFQPSEIIKLTGILYMTNYFSEKNKNKYALLIFWILAQVALLVQSASITVKFLESIGMVALLFLSSQLSPSKKSLVTFLLMLMTVFLLAIAQPDLGTGIVLICLFISTYLVSGKHTKEILGTLLVTLILGVILVISTPYRMNRITAFLDPTSDPYGKSYHINQILIGVSSGGVTGRGLFQSRQKYEFLPEAHTDSIFAIIAEETGLIGSALIFSLYFLLLNSIIKIASSINGSGEKIFLVSVFILISFQVIINLGGMTNLLPLTGIPLPFLSYGGTSLLMLFTLMGICINIAKNNN